MTENNEITQLENIVVEKEARAFGGWLILIAIGICLNPITLLAGTFSFFKEIFLSGAWIEIGNPNNPLYHALFKPTIIYELITNISMSIFSIVILVLFFKKSKKFPNTYVMFLTISLLAIIIDIILCNHIPVIKNQGLHDLYRQASRSAVKIMVWCPYMLKSSRVRDTFIK